MMNVLNEILTNKVTLVNMAGVSSAVTLENIEVAGLFFQAAQPILTGVIALTIISYNAVNIYHKVKHNKHGKK